MQEIQQEIRPDVLGASTSDRSAKIPAVDPERNVCGIVGERLTIEAFLQLSGKLAGYSFVKVVVDRETSKIHFINHANYSFHSDYIAENILNVTVAELEKDLDGFNESVYHNPDRRFYLGILALQKRTEKGQERRFYSLETVEVDTMNLEMVKYFYNFVKTYTDASLPIFFKPANHLQENIVAEISPSDLPRVFSHELFASARFIALNAGTAQGRLRVFRSELEYRRLFN